MFLKWACNGRDSEKMTHTWRPGYIFGHTYEQQGISCSMWTPDENIMENSIRLKICHCAWYVCVYAYVYRRSGAPSHKLASVHLYKIKSTSAGSHSDKINRIWRFLRCRQMLAPVPPEHFPSPPNYIQYHLSLKMPSPPTPHKTCTYPSCPQQDPFSLLIWFLILLLWGSVIRRTWVRLKACFMLYWSQLARSTHFHLSRQMTINAGIMHAVRLAGTAHFLSKSLRERQVFLAFSKCNVYKNVIFP